MSVTLTIDPAVETRAAAALKLTVRLEMAEMLQRIIPPLISLLGEAGDPDLLPTEARDAALDLMDELEARGYRIGRTA